MIEKTFLDMLCEKSDENAMIIENARELLRHYRLGFSPSYKPSFDDLENIIGCFKDLTIMFGIEYSYRLANYYIGAISDFVKDTNVGFPKFFDKQSSAEAFMRDLSVVVKEVIGGIVRIQPEKRLIEFIDEKAADYYARMQHERTNANNDIELINESLKLFILILLDDVTGKHDKMTFTDFLDKYLDYKTVVVSEIHQ